MKKSPFIKFVIVLLLHFFMACSIVSLTDITLDQSALLALKQSISSDPYNILSKNWSATASVCNWIGVTCGRHHHRVIALNLSHMGLVGVIPSDIGNMSFLSLLSIRNNTFHGYPPHELVYLRRLKSLDFGFNHFSGKIPFWFCSMPELQSLVLEENNFVGSIPSIIGNCTLLKEINLSENNLTGPIPPQIGNLHNLETLRIHNNNLNGTIPSEIFNMTAMKAIEMHANHLSGNLPSSMFLPNLVELQLWGNELEGPIHRSISNASKLTFLDLSDNSFIGIIPNELGSLKHLQVLNLARNHLAGEVLIPKTNFLSSLTNCKNLRRLELSGNPLDITVPASIGNLSSSLEHILAKSCNIRGFIPREIGNLSSLIALRLENNALTGTIPVTIGRLRKLQGFYLHGNRLNGTIPYGICELSRLADLSLGGNMLSGLIPDCLGNLSTLRNLNLSSNNLTSQIPLTLWNLKDIMTVNMSSNSLNGSLPSDIGNLKVAVYIDLSRNLLSGGLPITIGSLQNLIYLSLAENDLQGSIPNLGSLSLEFLDLSRNNLSGKIPKSLGELLYLKHFNVSFNKLQGEIPYGTSFGHFSDQSYMNNTALCRPSWQLELKILPPCKERNTAEREVNYLVILRVIIITITTLFSLSMLLLCTCFCKIRNMTMLVNQRLFDARRKENELPQRSKRISYQELLLATDGFSANNLVGSGSFGSVYKGTLKGGSVVAVKVFDVEQERASKSFHVEREIMSNTLHRNIVKIITSCRNMDFMALVLEYMPNGSLERWLHMHNHHMDILQLLDIMIDVASALEYLHFGYGNSRPIVHCDLKPSNILFDENMAALLCDFSIAKVLDERDLIAQTTTLGTIGYMAPEYGSNGNVSTKTDVFSFGILLMETFTRKKPTDNMFGGEMNLKRWVEESLPFSVERVTDANLLHVEDEYFAAKKWCISSIMDLALDCSVDSVHERVNMKGALSSLNEIKKQYMQDIIGDP